jgi:hypothetical protein
LRPGEITEICGSPGTTHLVMDALLERWQQAGVLGAWVDAGDSLEVADWCPHHLQRMLWVRCRSALTALKAADLLLRDGNCAWVTLDLQAAPPPSLRRLQGAHWHRFHRLLTHQGTSLLVLSRTPLVEGVRVRVLAAEPYRLESLERPRSELRDNAPLRIFVRGRTPHCLQEPPGRNPAVSTA